MDDASAAAAALAIVVIVLVIAAYVWYNYTGWTAFSYKAGDSPAWVPAAGADVSRLRFKDCTFSVVRSDGVSATYNVDPALNGMAVAYKGGVSNPSTLTLTRPLNAFSFVVPGFNDRATVNDPSAAPWCAGAPGAGGCTGTSVSLAGKWRTI